MPNTKLAIKYNGNSINHMQKHNIMKQVLANKSILNILFKKKPHIKWGKGRVSYTPHLHSGSSPCLNEHHLHAFLLGFGSKSIHVVIFMARV